MPYTIVQFRRSKARAVASGGDQLEANIQRAVKEVGDIAIFSKLWSKKRASNYRFLLLFWGVLVVAIQDDDAKTENMAIIDLLCQGPPK